MEIKDAIRYRYPYPIALTYHNTGSTRETVGLHDQILRLFEVILKYLATIAISQYIQDEVRDERVNQVLRGLARPSLGQWNGFLREILHYYDRSGRKERLLIPEMYDAYFQKSKDRPAVSRAYNVIQNFLEDRSDSKKTSLAIREFCDRMINYRNKTTGHGAVTIEHCRLMNEPLLAALEEVLVTLDFLEEHRLVYIEDVRLRRGKYSHEMMSFMGSVPPSRMRSAYVAEGPTDYKVEEQLYLCARGEDTPILSLHPLIIAYQGDILFLNESEREKDIEYLSYQTGQIKRPDRLLEDFREIMGPILEGEAGEITFGRPVEEVVLEAQAVEISPDLPPYQAGLVAYQARDWTQAIDFFGRVAEDDPQYQDAQTRLEVARQRKENADLYTHMRTCMAERKWDEALAALRALEEKTVKDASISITAEAARLSSMEDLYLRTQKALENQQWERVLELSRRLYGLNPDYRDVRAILRRQERLAEWYTQAVEAMTERRWAVALTNLKQLESAEPGYKDMKALVARAQQGIDEEANLAELYSQAKAQIALGNWAEALKSLEEIGRQEPDYRDIKSLIAETRDRLVQPCWQCGNPVPPGRSFCGRCGAPRSRPAGARVKKPARPRPAKAAPPPGPEAGWTCWRCGQQMPDERKFCGKCGAPQQKPETLTCPRCGQEYVPGRQFCGSCGHKLT